MSSDDYEGLDNMFGCLQGPVKKQADTSLSEDELAEKLCHPLCACSKCAELKADRFSDNVVTLDSITTGGYTALHLACLHSKHDVVNLLCQLGASRELPDDYGRTPLHCAAMAGSQKCVLLLIHYDARLNMTDLHGWTPLHTACHFGNDECVKAMIYQPPSLREISLLNLNAQDVNGRTALHLASEQGYEEIVSVLLENGAKMSVQDKQDKRPLDLVETISMHRIFAQFDRGHTLSALDPLENGWIVIADSILSPEDAKTGNMPLLPPQMSKKKKRVEVEARLDKLIKAVLDNDLPMVQHLLKQTGAPRDADSKSDSRSLGDVTETPCHPLCQCDICKDTQTPGSSYNLSDINLSGSDGMTPLCAAVIRGYQDILERLLSKGADTNTPVTHRDYMPLHLAAQRNEFKIAELLLEHDAAVDAVDKHGNTALHMAASRGHNNVLRCLVRYNASLNSSNHLGNTPLHEAAKWDRTETVKLLLDSGATPSLSNHMGLTPKEVARSKDTAVIFQT